MIFAILRYSHLWLVFTSNQIPLKVAEENTTFADPDIIADLLMPSYVMKIYVKFEQLTSDVR